MAEAMNSSEEWPGVDLAFGFVIPSYQWIITRFEAVDSRIQTLQAFIATMTFAFPAIATTLSESIQFRSPWFVAALVVAAIAVVCGVIGRSWGGIVVCSPETLYEKWLGKSEWTFKKDMVYFAGQHFAANTRLINIKGRIVVGMTILFLCETGLLLRWIISSFRQ